MKKLNNKKIDKIYEKLNIPLFIFKGDTFVNSQGNECVIENTTLNQIQLKAPSGVYWYSYDQIFHGFKSKKYTKFNRKNRTSSKPLIIKILELEFELQNLLNNILENYNNKKYELLKITKSLSEFRSESSNKINFSTEYINKVLTLVNKEFPELFTTKTDDKFEKGEWVIGWHNCSNDLCREPWKIGKIQNDYAYPEKYSHTSWNTNIKNLKKITNNETYKVFTKNKNCKKYEYPEIKKEIFKKELIPNRKLLLLL